LEKRLAKKKRKRKNMSVDTNKQKKVSKTSNYIDNDKMYEEMREYVKNVAEYNKLLSTLKPEDPKPKKPAVSEYIGKCIMMIAQRLATKPNFANYTHREEMIGDGIENCLMYIDNFNPKKSKNPFAYFTQIIYFAFIRRIQKEKKQAYVKMKMFEEMDVKGSWLKKAFKNDMDDARFTSKSASKNMYADYFKLSQNDIDIIEKNNKKDLKKKSRKSNLEDFFE
jgi:hypothetical protein